MPARRARGGAGAAVDLPAGGGVPVGEPEGLGDGAGRGVGLCDRAFGLGLCGVAAVFAGVNLPSVSVWAGAGQACGAGWRHRRRLRAFNWTMAGLLVLSLIPVLRH